MWLTSIAIQERRILLVPLNILLRDYEHRDLCPILRFCKNLQCCSSVGNSGSLGKAIVPYDHQQLWANQLNHVKGVELCYLLGLKIAEVNLSLQLCFSK